MARYGTETLPGTLALPGGPGSGRLDGLDTLRGEALVSMIVYHTCWDIVYLWGADWGWYRSYGAYLWQQSICWTFILLSGFCFRLGHHRLRGGIMLSFWGWAIGAVSSYAMPEDRIFFGILSLLGAAALLTVPLDRAFRHIPARLGVAVSFVLFLLTRDVASGLLGFGGVSISSRGVPAGISGLIHGAAAVLTAVAGGLTAVVELLSGFDLTAPDFTAMLPDLASFQGIAAVRLPESLYINDFTAALGFPPLGFRSNDWFPLLPWLFLFWTGYFLYPLHPVETPRQELPLFTFLGRHSLVTYLIHQPLIYGILWSLSGQDPAVVGPAVREVLTVAEGIWGGLSDWAAWAVAAVRRFVQDIESLISQLRFLYETLRDLQ